MANIIDYLKWRGDLSFELYPINEVDNVILARFSYLPFQDIYLEARENIKSIAQKMQIVPKSNFVWADDKKFIEELAKTRRFQNLIVSDYVQKIELLDNPNFLFLEYASKELYIKYLFLIPRYFFCVDTIQKRQPLTSLTRRQGWVGCDILFQRIPTEGFIYIVENMTEHTIEEILEKRGRTNFMRSYKPRAREWIIDLLNLIQDREFTLEEMCSYAPIMEIRYAGINNAEDRIRKVLQILRRNEIIAYAGNGKYVKTEKQFTQ